MKYLTLMAMPHLNVRAALRALKLASRDFSRDDEVIALPEGLTLAWFEAPRVYSAERLQNALAHSERDIGEALPALLCFADIEHASERWRLPLEPRGEPERLAEALQKFALEADLRLCPSPPLYAEAAELGLILGSAEPEAAFSPISFKKYELVIYLAELPDTPLCGFQFRAIARAHRKSARGPRHPQHLQE